MSKIKECPICGSKMSSSFYLTILGKYKVEYFVCKNCGFLQTEKPYWLEEAYSTAIADIDTGILNRNIVNCNRVEPVLYRLFPQNSVIVDEAGGYGILARLLRDKGFDCYSFDKFCENIFAKDFIPNEKFRADAILAFEVFEHIEDITEFVNDTFNKYKCKTILFSTLVYENCIPDENWWYYTPESGQHISFYSINSLNMLAGKLGCTYYRITKNFHIITDLKLSHTDKLLLLNSIVFKIYFCYVRFIRRKCSKIHEDFKYLSQKIKNNYSNV